MLHILSKSKRMKTLRTPESDKKERDAKGPKDEKSNALLLDLKDLKLGGPESMDSPIAISKTGIQYLKTKIDETGIANIAKNCPLLQELDLYQCTDETLRTIAVCENLYIVRLIGSVTCFYHCTFTDIGFTIMSHIIRQLVRLELSGCEASYEGISTLGKCCMMLEELTISNKGFYKGWVAALSCGLKVGSRLIGIQVHLHM